MTSTLLYLHLISLAALLLNAGAVHLTEVRAALAQTTGEAKRLLNTSVALGPVFGIGSALLVVTGASLAHYGDEEFSLGSSWIVCAFIALVIINGVGAGILAPRVKRVAETLDGGTDRLTEAQRSAVHDVVVSRLGWFNTITAFGIILLMVAKPAVGGCLAVLLVAAVAGLALGTLQHTMVSRAVRANAALAG